jgi:hypothetical protein
MLIQSFVFLLKIDLCELAHFENDFSCCGACFSNIKNQIGCAILLMGQRHGILSSIFKLVDIMIAIVSINTTQDHDVGLCIIYCNKI